jgi:DNA adenine methylase
VGGKRQLLDVLTPLLPGEVNTYCEPFVGGGALLFDLQPKVAYVNDINAELIHVYEVIKSDVEALVTALQDFENKADYFYAVRDWDRDKVKYSALSDIKKAARMLYLNKTCYNGLFRVNNAGEFNSPFGNYRNPNIVNAPTLRAVSSYLNTAAVHLTSLDYPKVLRTLPEEAFVYLDPPYDPVSDTAGFTGYAKGGFSRDAQMRLRECCDELHKRGLKFMLSNSATDFIKEQYAAYHITIVQAKRAINSDATKRGEVEEVVVRNYE